MAFATASSPANRKPGDNAQTATPPQAQARPRQSPGNAEPPTRARAPACARARQRAPGPQRMPGPRRVLGRNRAPERKPSRAARSRSISQAGPQRTPTPPMHARTKTGLRSVTQAEQRVPAARNRHFCPAAVKRNDSSQTQGQNTRFFALSEGPYADKRQKRPSLTSETAKNRLF